jgi:hypothetical protein
METARVHDAAWRGGRWPFATGAQQRERMRRGVRRASGGRRAYTHAAEYWSERVKMMQAWADYLDNLKESGRVLQLSVAAE